MFKKIQYIFFLFGIVFFYFLGLVTYKENIFPLNIYREIVKRGIFTGTISTEPQNYQAQTLHIVSNASELEGVKPFDFNADPIGRVFYKNITPIVRTILNRYEKNRLYSSNDFPLDEDKHRLFRKKVIKNLYENINTQNYNWESQSSISKNYKADLLEILPHADYKLYLYRVTIFETEDEVPIVKCVPKNSEKSPLPGVILFSGHTSNSGLFDLFVDRGGYQKAMALELCENGFITLGVEKLDSGYTTIAFQNFGRVSPVEREPGGGGDDELEVATTILNTGDHVIFARQLMANLASFDLLKRTENIDLENIGTAGVSFGGWQSLHLALLRDDVKAISNFGGMWSHLEIHMEDWNLSEFEGVPDYSQSFPGLFLLGDQNRFVLAAA